MSHHTDTHPGRTILAGEELSDEEMARQVTGQTSSDRAAAEFFRRERGGAMTDTEAAKVDPDILAGSEK